MSENNKKAQALIKRDTLENWNKAKNYIPVNGIIIIIDMPDNSIQLKFGDGATRLEDLPNILDKKEEKSAPVYSDELLEFK